MKSPDTFFALQGRWTSLWAAALVSLVAQLWLCQFFSFGERVPMSLDVNPSNLWRLAYHFPPSGTFQVLNWLGVAYLPQPLHPFSLAAAWLSPWWFFTAYTPIMATLALLAMAAFLREFELSRPAALFGGVIYAWQGDLLPFIYPGHYAYIATWFFFAIGAWGALRTQRTKHWAYALISGACCGLMVSLQPDRGAIASVLIGLLYLAPILQRFGADRTLVEHLATVRRFLLCVLVAVSVALASLLAMFKGNIVGAKLAGTSDREQLYKLVTQYCLAPSETLTYLVPGFFGWHSNSQDGPYWGWIGEWPDWPKNHQGSRNLNLAISTIGTVATVLALVGATLLVWEGVLGADRLTERQRFFGRLLLALGFITLILSWGWHTPLYRPLFALPLMDKWRNPLKWLEMTNFALVVLSAVGMQHLTASVDAAAPDINNLRNRLAWFTTASLLLLGAVFLLSYPLGLFLTSMLEAEGCDPVSVGNMISTMHLSLFWAFAIMAFFCFVLRSLWQPKKLRAITLVNPVLKRMWNQMLQPENLPTTLALALSALAAIQLGWVARQFIQPEPLQDLTMSNPLLEALRSEGDTVRVAVPVDDTLLRQVLMQNQFLAMNISSLDISAASRIPDDYNTFTQTLANNGARLWFLAGVKNVAVPEEALAQMRRDPSVASNIDHADGYSLVPTSSPDVPSHALVGMKDYLSKATFVPRVEVFASDDELLKRLNDSNWDARETVLFARPVAITVPPPQAPAGTSDHVTLKTYTPTEIEIEAQTSRSGFVLVNDQYDPDWQVQVNGHDVPLLRADYIMRAVAIPAGLSKITMRYASHYQVGGLNLSAKVMSNFSDGVMLASWLIAGFVLLRRKES